MNTIYRVCGRSSYLKKDKLSGKEVDNYSISHDSFRKSLVQSIVAPRTTSNRFLLQQYHVPTNDFVNFSPFSHLDHRVVEGDALKWLLLLVVGDF